MTIEEIYVAINPLPAMLLAKGKINPTVEFKVEANAGLAITMNYKKPHGHSEWDKEYHHFSGANFSEALDKAVSFINDLPSAKQAKLTHFMGALGKLIDIGKSEGIEIEYLNPLTDSMKRLSKNILTFKKPRRGAVNV